MKCYRGLGKNGETLAYGSNFGAMDYMARYVNRTAIANQRILHVDDQNVTIKTKDRQTQQEQQHLMTSSEFIKRFVAHILPKGFTRVRWYGFLSCAKRKVSIDQIREFLDDLSIAVSSKFLDRILEQLMQRLSLKTCPSCRQGTVRAVHLLPCAGYMGRSTPTIIAPKDGWGHLPWEATQNRVLAPPNVTI